MREEGGVPIERSRQVAVAHNSELSVCGPPVTIRAAAIHPVVTRIAAHTNLCGQAPYVLVHALHSLGLDLAIGRCVTLSFRRKVKRIAPAHNAPPRR